MAYAKVAFFDIYTFDTFYLGRATRTSIGRDVLRLGSLRENEQTKKRKNEPTFLLFIVVDWIGRSIGGCRSVCCVIVFCNYLCLFFLQ
jgi:hypothetical protein